MHRRGFVLITALTMLVVLMALLTAYFTLTRVEISTTAANANATTGFYAAEAGLNLRAEAVKGMFTGGPPTTSGTLPTLAECVATQGGGSSSSFGCWRAGNIQGRTVDTSLRPADAGTTSGTGTAGQVAPGEAFAGLRYTEFNYDLSAQAALRDQPEAILGMRFRVRQIPLFQFMAFYDEDLELGPGPQMTLNGPVHTNGDLYLSASNGDSSPLASLDITGQVTAVGNLVRGRKNGDSEQSGTPCPGLVRIRPSGSASADPSIFPSLLPSGGSGGSCPYQLATNFAAFNGSVRAGNATEGLRINRLQVPSPDSLDPIPGFRYWDAADVRIVLNIEAPNSPNAPAIEVHTRDSIPSNVVGNSPRSRNPQLNLAATALVNTSIANPGTCPGSAPLLNSGNTPVLVGSPNTRAVGYSQSFVNARERIRNTDTNDTERAQAERIQMLEVDMGNLLTCIRNNQAAFGVNPDSRGVVLHFSVSGPNTRVGCSVNATSSSDRCEANNYGVRIRNGAQLNNSPDGLTVATNQALYVQGDYNSVNKKPSALLSDSINLLSNAWQTDTEDLSCRGPLQNPPVCTDGPDAADTTVNAAFLSGVDLTGNGNYNGGLQNYPRFHENWSGRALTYRGSFISLDRSRYSNGVFNNQRYNPPIRRWSYDTDFNTKLPPLTPTVTQLEQELFSREFEQGR